VAGPPSQWLALTTGPYPGTGTHASGHSAPLGSTRRSSGSSTRRSTTEESKGSPSAVVPFESTMAFEVSASMAFEVPASGVSREPLASIPRLSAHSGAVVRIGASDGIALPILAVPAAPTRCLREVSATSRQDVIGRYDAA
jgi:hypothetical protein